MQSNLANSLISGSNQHDVDSSRLVWVETTALIHSISIAVILRGGKLFPYAMIKTLSWWWSLLLLGSFFSEAKESEKLFIQTLQSLLGGATNRYKATTEERSYKFSLPSHVHIQIILASLVGVNAGSLQNLLISIIVSCRELVLHSIPTKAWTIKNSEKVLFEELHFREGFCINRSAKYFRALRMNSIRPGRSARS